MVGDGEEVPLWVGVVKAMCQSCLEHAIQRREKHHWRMRIRRMLHQFLYYMKPNPKHLMKHFSRICLYLPSVKKKMKIVSGFENVTKFVNSYILPKHLYCTKISSKIKWKIFKGETRPHGGEWCSSGPRETCLHTKTHKWKLSQTVKFFGNFAQKIFRSGTFLSI